MKFELVLWHLMKRLSHHIMCGLFIIGLDGNQASLLKIEDGLPRFLLFFVLFLESYFSPLYVVIFLCWDCVFQKVFDP